MPRRCPIVPNGRRLREASRDFLTPWEPTWPADDLTRSSFRRRIKRYSEDQRSDLAYAFSFSVRDDVLVGGLTLANIRRGCAQAGSLGYWMGAAYAPGSHDGCGQRHHSIRIRDAEAASDRGGMHPCQCRVDPAPGRPGSSAKALPANIFASMARGRTTCCTLGSRMTSIRSSGPPWGRHGLTGITRVGGGGL